MAVSLVFWCTSIQLDVQATVHVLVLLSSAVKEMLLQGLPPPSFMLLLSILSGALPPCVLEVLVY